VFFTIKSLFLTNSHIETSEFFFSVLSLSILLLADGAFFLPFVIYKRNIFTNFKMKWKRTGKRSINILTKVLELFHTTIKEFSFNFFLSIRKYSLGIFLYYFFLKKISRKLLIMGNKVIVKGGTSKELTPQGCDYDSFKVSI
jgi:hypothetical protein